MPMQDNKSRAEQHTNVKEQFDEAQIDGRYEEGMARMSLYHHYCQDPVIFQALGDVREKSLLDLACGNGFYTRRFRSECGAYPVMGLDLSPQMIARAEAIERRDPLGIEYQVGDVASLDLKPRFHTVTAIHLLHYLESEAEIKTVLRKIYETLDDGGKFVTMIINPDFDIEKHNAADSRRKFAYYFSSAEPGNGGRMRFHPGGFEKERELTVEFRRWTRDFINRIADEVGFTHEWHDPFISVKGIMEYGVDFFENYLSNPQSKLLLMTK